MDWTYKWNIFHTLPVIFASNPTNGFLLFVLFFFFFFWGFFFLLLVFSLQKLNCMRSGDLLGLCRIFLDFTLKKKKQKNLQGCWHAAFGSLSICTVKRSPIHFASHGWPWAESRSSEHSRIPPAAPELAAGRYAYLFITLFERRCRVFRVRSRPEPSSRRSVARVWVSSVPGLIWARAYEWFAPHLFPPVLSHVESSFYQGPGVCLPESVFHFAGCCGGLFVFLFVFKSWKGGLPSFTTVALSL